MFNRKTGAVAILALVALVLTACAAGPNTAANITEAGQADPAGFWFGLWHGIISPITFFVSLFDNDVSIYEVRNTGNWYDFGFVLGAGILLGGGSSAR